MVAKRELASARVLARTFHEHHPEIAFVVLLADEVEGRFDPRHEPFELVLLDQLALPGSAALRFRYPRRTLSFALTPFFLRHLLSRGRSRLLFLKQESLVLGSLRGAYQALAESPILLTPHLTEPLSGPGAIDRELSVLLAGTHNAGCVGVGDQPEASRFLDWWCDRVSTHGHHDVAAGFHHEQRWLDLVPAYFPGACLLRGLGDNVGHWNLPERRIEIAGGRVLAGGEPCRLFRFSGYDPARPERVTTHSDRLATSDLGEARAIFDGYRRLLFEAGHEEASRWTYAWDRFDDGTPIPELAREAFRELGEEVASFGDPFETGGAGSFRAWLGSPAEEWAATAPALSRFWHVVWRRRTDLRRAFPDPTGSDRDRFLAWVRSSGRTEHPGGEHLLPGGPP